MRMIVGLGFHFWRSGNWLTLIDPSLWTDERLKLDKYCLLALYETVEQLLVPPVVLSGTAAGSR